MRVIGGLVALFIGTIVAAAVAARAAKDRIVRRDDPAADEVAVVAIFEPLSFRSTATAFRGGTLDCWFGGGMFDLREATLNPAGATLRVKTIFGGAQVLVPEGWQVETRIIGIGGAGDSRPAIFRAADAPRLTIEGVALFGGLGVSSVAPEGSEEWMRRSQGEAAPGAAGEQPESPQAVPVMVN